MSIGVSLVAAAALAAVAGYGLPAGAAERVVTLNGLTIALDENTGALLRLEYPGVGAMLRANHDAAGMLSLAYPTSKFAPLRLEARLSRAAIDVQDRRVEIRWDRLEPSRKNFDYEGRVSARVMLTASPDGRSVVWQCEITNHTSLPVPQVLFPDLRGLRAFDGAANTRLDFPGGVVTTSMDLPRKVLKPFEDEAQPVRAPFYVKTGEARYNLPLQWLNFGSLRGGFCLFPRRWGLKEPRYELLTRRPEADPGSLFLYWDHRPAIQTGGAWKSYEYVMTPHTGGWAAGIGVFRAFVRENFVGRPPLPVHVRDGLGFWSPWMIEGVETDPARAAFRFADLPAMGKEASEHGLTEIVPWRWNDYWTQFPFTIRRELGTEEEFLSGLRAIKKTGVGVSPFISIMIARPNVAARYGLKLDGTDYTYHPELIPMMGPGYTTGNVTTRVGPENPLWVRDTQEILRSWIRKGVCSISWDLFMGSRDALDKLVGIFREIRSEARACDPQSSLSGENYRDYETVGEVLDFTWNWNEYSEAWQILTSVLPYPRLNVNVQNSPLDVKRAFMDNLYMNVMPKHPDMPNGTAWIHEFPALSEALKQCAALRRRFLPYFVSGDFLGSSVLAEPARAVVTGYQRPDGMLLIALNPDRARLTEKIAVRLDEWLGPESKHLSLTIFDGRGGELERRTVPSGDWRHSLRDLAPEDLRLFEFRATSGGPGASAR